ncbi:DUF483 domain-containing protein [Methanothermococcus sp.]|uniref:DUF483 domain-containing protein n=1 Tax=Methanothermococcus sp. TaxID=2614238 RepID=UPI0025F12C51|nr:DUF483 domain-containing protein [Methanothermococcus sp.]
MNAVNSMEEILKKITSAREGKFDLNYISSHIQNIDDENYNYIIFRLMKQIEVVKKYNPKVRPAIDPVVSSVLGVYSGLDFSEEYGTLMGYPKCCVESFKSARFGIDAKHLKEADKIKDEIKKDKLETNKDLKEKVAIIMPSGFIPCSLKCEEAWKRNLIDIVSYNEYLTIQKLEEELFKVLPHFHGAYNEYYEKILLL